MDIIQHNEIVIHRALRKMRRYLLPGRFNDPSDITQDDLIPAHDPKQARAAMCHPVQKNHARLGDTLFRQPDRLPF